MEAPNVQDALISRALLLAQAELSEALRDFALALLLPPNEGSQTAKLAGCMAGIDRAVARVRGELAKR